jgi:hypothetical protein
MITTTDIAGDIVKLAIQFIGALVVARLTVQWALGRFKREKKWEREVTALADVVGALRK